MIIDVFGEVEPVALRHVASLVAQRREFEDLVAHVSPFGVARSIGSRRIEADGSRSPLPRFVVRELRAFLECGLLCFG